jgi:hypothetical protein
LTDTEKRNGNYDGEDIVKRWLEDAVDGIMERYDIRPRA